MKFSPQIALVTTRPIPYLHQTSSVLRRSPLELLFIAGIIYYTCSLVIDIHCTRHKNAFNKGFNELCIKITLLISIPKKNIIVCHAVYFRLCIDLMHIAPPVTAEGLDGSHHPRYAECPNRKGLPRVSPYVQVDKPDPIFCLWIDIRSCVQSCISFTFTIIYFHERALETLRRQNEYTVDGSYRGVSAYCSSVQKIQNDLTCYVLLVPRVTVTSSFSFFHNVFKSCLMLMCQNEYLWSKGLKRYSPISGALDENENTT